MGKTSVSCPQGFAVGAASQDSCLPAPTDNFKVTAMWDTTRSDLTRPRIGTCALKQSEN